MKTNAVRLLEEMGVPHELRAYEVDPDDLTAQTVADKIGLTAEQVFKTLVARGDRHGVCFAVVPGNCRLDLKALAKLTGKSAFLGGLRQFTAAFLATGAAFAIGHLISGHVM